MGIETGISWAKSTFNPWIGCTKVSPACDHCYAEARMDSRLHVVNWGPKQPRKRTSAANWRQPLAWNKQAAATGEFWPVFCSSLADVFDNEVDPQWRADLFALIAKTPHLTWLLLTKRIGNASKMIAEALVMQDDPIAAGAAWPWPHVWLGATICNQDEADRDIPKLLATPAAKRFVSIEPMLGAVDLRLPTRTFQLSNGALACNHCCNGDRCDDPTHFTRGRPDYAAHCRCPHCRGTGRGRPIDWVIAGGESGHGARYSPADRFRSLRNQCAAAGVPFLFKQWGEFLPDSQNPKMEQPQTGTGGIKVGKAAAGRLLDGRTHDEFPESRRMV